MDKYFDNFVQLYTQSSKKGLCYVTCTQQPIYSYMIVTQCLLTPASAPVPDKNTAPGILFPLGDSACDLNVCPLFSTKITWRKLCFIQKQS